MIVLFLQLSFAKILAYFSHHQTRIYTIRTIFIHSDGIITCEFVFLISHKKKKVNLTYYYGRLQVNVFVSVFVGGAKHKQ